MNVEINNDTIKVVVSDSEYLKDIEEIYMKLTDNIQFSASNDSVLVEELTIRKIIKDLINQYQDKMVMNKTYKVYITILDEKYILTLRHNYNEKYKDINGWVYGKIITAIS